MISAFEASRPEAIEELRPGRRVGQVGADGLVMTAGLLRLQNVPLVIQDARQIHIDPAQRGRERQAPGAGVEPGGQVDDQVDGAG